MTAGRRKWAVSLRGLKSDVDVCCPASPNLCFFLSRNFGLLRANTSTVSGPLGYVTAWLHCLWANFMNVCEWVQKRLQICEGSRLQAQMAFTELRTFPNALTNIQEMSIPQRTERANEKTNKQTNFPSKFARTRVKDSNTRHRIWAPLLPKINRWSLISIMCPWFMLRQTLLSLLFSVKCCFFRLELWFLLECIPCSTNNKVDLRIQKNTHTQVAWRRQKRQQNKSSFCNSLKRNSKKYFIFQCKWTPQEKISWQIFF